MQNQESDRYKIMLIELFRILLKIVFNGFMRVKVIDRDKLPKEGAVILTANHVGMLDMFMIGYRIPRLVHWMAKEELFHVKLLAPLIRKLGAFPIARGKGDTAAVEFAINTVKSGQALILFPEGTRSKTGELLKLKSGMIVIAAQSKGTIIPTTIVFEGKLHFRSRVTIRYGKPISCEELNLKGIDRESLKQARDLVTSRMQELLEAGF